MLDRWRRFRNEEGNGEEAEKNERERDSPFSAVSGLVVLGFVSRSHFRFGRGWRTFRSNCMPAALFG